MSVTETNEASARTARSVTPVLRAVGVVKRFGDNVVLRGLDLDVASHEVVVLLGASGSGKSTLLRCANLLERVDDGQIFLGGEDITDPRANADKIRARIGVVFQHYNLFPHMSVLDNVTLAARKVHGWEKGRAHERGLELLDRIGLKDKAKEYPDRLSGGQQQRVAIARALATNPELLLLDEITAGCAGPGARRRGPGPRARNQGTGLDHPHGDARNQLRPPGGRPRRVPAQWPDRRAGPARAGHRQPARAGHQGLPGTHPALTPHQYGKARTGREPVRACVITACRTSLVKTQKKLTLAPDHATLAHVRITSVQTKERLT